MGAFSCSDRVEAFELKEFPVFSAVVAFVHERGVWVLCPLPAWFWGSAVEDSICLSVRCAKGDVGHDVLLFEPLDGRGGWFVQGEFEWRLCHGVCVGLCD